jgi:hypothetical protein
MRSMHWWETLGKQDRRSLRRRLRYRDEVIVARFSESDGDDQPVPSEFYEYLVGHELYLENGRKFQICSAHPQARNALEQGRIAHDFRCPRAEAGCPLRRLLAQRPGHDCVLTFGTRPRRDGGER